MTAYKRKGSIFNGAPIWLGYILFMFYLYIVLVVGGLFIIG